MSERLKGRVAIITGSGMGIGRAIANLMAREGASVVVNDLGSDVLGEGESTSVADKAVAEITANGGEAIANYEDVADFEGARRLVKSAIDAFGRLDILVNNAGISRRVWLHEMTEQDWDLVLDVNLKGTFNCIRHACVPMRHQRYGRIVNIGSPAGIIRGGGVAGRRANYGASKGGVHGLTNLICFELGIFGITVNLVLPGGAETRMSSAGRSQHKATTSAGDPMSKALEGSMTDLVVTPPEDVAPLVTYLCTEDAGYINGHMFYSIGGSCGWYRPMELSRQIFKEGRWTIDELTEMMPRTLALGLENPQPELQ